jgi:hypothetical protein
MTEVIMSNFERELMNRLIRIESKLVRGFEEIGVNIDKDANWLSVDNASRVVYIATLGRSMTVILSDMAREGATHTGEVYELIHKGDVVGTILFSPVVYKAA